MLLRQGERGREQARLLVGELQVGRADRAEPAAGRERVAVLAAHAGDAGGHAVGELAHGRGADRGEELVAVGEVPVGGVGHHADHPGRFAEHDGVGAAGPGQLEPGGDQAVADGASRPPPPCRGSFRCWSARVRLGHDSNSGQRPPIKLKWTASTKCRQGD